MGVRVRVGLGIGVPVGLGVNVINVGGPVTLNAIVALAAWNSKSTFPLGFRAKIVER